MNFTSVLKMSAVALGAVALVASGFAPAQAAPTYPPHVSTLYASPVLEDGRAAVVVVGTDLKAGMSVKATRGTHSTTAAVHVNSAGTAGSANVNVGSILSKTAGVYAINFALSGASLTGVTTTSQTYTVGKAISIKSFSVKGKTYGLLISGTAAKSTPVKITIKIGSKTYTKTVKAKADKKFSYKFKKTTKGTYTVTAKVAANKKYFSDAVSVTYVRS